LAPKRHGYDKYGGRNTHKILLCSKNISTEATVIEQDTRIALKISGFGDDPPQTLFHATTTLIVCKSIQCVDDLPDSVHTFSNLSELQFDAGQISGFSASVHDILKGKYDNELIDILLWELPGLPLPIKEEPYLLPDAFITTVCFHNDFRDDLEEREPPNDDYTMVSELSNVSSL
jgi:hypothetical protein